MTQEKQQTPTPARTRFFRRVKRLALVICALYVFAVALIMIPIVQTYVIYAHHIDFFNYNKFDHPEHYGLARKLIVFNAGKTVNLKLQSSDNVTLGAWFVFSDPFYRKAVYPPPPRTTAQDKSLQLELIPTAIAHRPTILFLHGNTGTRAHHLRTVLYTAFTSRLDANVLAVDYRGFGDSQGYPTVQGVGWDARAAWNFLIDQGAKPENVLIVGHSLGTAIAGLLASQLGAEGIHPRGTVLMSPFSSARKLVDEYYLFGFLPLLRPLSMIPLAPRLVTWSMVHKFDTLTLVPHIKSDVLIAHADNDWDIPSTHSITLFNAFLSPYLPPTPPLPPPSNPLSASEWENQTAYGAVWARTREEVVLSTRIEGYGLYEEMHSEIVKKEGRRVALLRTESGKHDIGRVEGVQDAIGRMFDLY